jgi:anti-anti-sigma regulatory factor
MVQTISLHHVLQEAVATPYRNLVTRATGAAVRGRIEATLATGTGHTTLLDFSGVDCLDLSCADEIVAKLLLAAASGDRVLVLTGVREEQREALEHVLAHHHLAVAACFSGSEAPDVLGWVTGDAREAFAEIRRHGSATSSGLAVRLAWPMDRTLVALNDLAGHRIAQPVGEVYHLVTLP